jgi:hypothetical protein
MNFQINDVVVLGRDVPEQGLTAGMRGTIVFIFEMPSLAYEVEFIDRAGRTICTIALRLDELTAVGQSAI